MSHTLVFVGDNTREIAAIPDGMNDSDVFDAAMKEIRAFCEYHNFKIYYTRVWNESEATVFDVGSHTEFFHLIPPVVIPTE